jgi:DNA-binding NarL/FixJ family response regulator
MQNEITVLLVDDHSLVRKGFRRMLEDDPDIRVVGEAGSGREAVDAAERLRPKVIVMDMSMPEMDGVEATREIRKRMADASVLIVSMYSQENYVRNRSCCASRWNQGITKHHCIELPG